MAFLIVKKLLRFLLPFKKKDQGARFAKWREARRIVNNRNTGLRITRRKFLSQQDSFNHTLLVAPSGAGKTSSFVIPAALESQMSLIITDLAGEIFQQTSGHLQDRGFKIMVLNLQNPNCSVLFNPLLRAKNDPHKLRRVIASVIQGSVNGGDAFWPQSAINLLFVLASGLVNYPDDRYITFKNLRYLLAKIGSRELDDFMATYLPDRASMADYKSLLSTSENTLSSIVATARTCLDTLNDPVISKIFSGDTLDISKLRRKRGALFIICPETKISYYNLALNLIYEEIFSQLIEQELKPDSIPISVLMDEAGNQRIENLDIILTTARKRKISISLILQEISQLRDRYGTNKAQTMISGGISNRLLFPGLSPESCELFSRALGMQTERNGKTGFETRRPLLSPDELRMLSGVVMLSGARRPVRLEMVPYFKDRRLKSLAAKTAITLSEINDQEGSPLLELE